MRPRTVPNAYRSWPWHHRMIERIYRATHGGQIRTLVRRPVNHPSEETIERWRRECGS